MMMSTERIAVVGLSCRLPGDCNDLDAFFRVLAEARNTVTEVPADRWSRSFFGGPTSRAGKTVAHTGSFLSDVAGFDPSYFELPDDEAAALDPQQRLLLELAIEAIEDAGLPERALRGRNVGAFAGITLFDYALMQLREAAFVGPYAHNTKQYIAPNRISNFLDLRGPSFTLDAACATSLIAVHLACQSLRSGECDAAICGSANVQLLPQFSIGFSQLGTISPTGRCKPFDAAADGYHRADAAAVIVLKRLSDALRDRDRIHAVIRGSGTCHGGRNPLGPWAPRHEQQAALLASVLSDAGVAPDEVAYVEAHAPGTQVGDKEEALALSQALAKARRAPLPIGSVKGAFGHSEGAAGITGVLKGIAILANEAIPPTPVAKPREDVSLEALGLRIVDRLEPLTKDGPSVVGVNSFGVGGSYAHLLLERPPRTKTTQISVGAPKEETPRLVPISARSAGALAARVAQLRDHVGKKDFGDLVHTLALRRTHHEYRAAVVAANAVELRDALGAAVLSDSAAPRKPRVVFVFSGAGGQWWAMARELFAEEPTFRTAIEAFDAAWTKLGGFSLVGEMKLGEGETKIGSTTLHSTVAQVAVQVALFRLWEAWGIVPDEIVAHSIGELAGAHCAGALSLEELAAMTKMRCEWQKTVDGLGAMAAVGLSEEETRRLLEEHAELDIAALNAPSSTTVSGPTEAIARLCQALEAKGVFCRQLRVTIPSHGRIVRAHHDKLLASAVPLAPVAPRIPFVPGVLGRRCDVPVDVAFCLRSFEQPVQFMRAIEAVAADGELPSFVEIGPHPVLATSIEECLERLRPGQSRLVVASLRRKEPERRTILAAAARLFEGGHVPDFAALGAANGELVSLPAYPWQRKVLWSENEASRRERFAPEEHPLLGTLRRAPDVPSRLVAETRLGPPVLAFLGGHVVGGDLVYPGAAFVEMMRAAAAAVLESAVDLVDVTFARALVVAHDGTTRVRTVVDELRHTIRVYASNDAGESWTDHAGCRFQAASSAGAQMPGDALAGATAIDLEEHYRAKRTAGYHFGPHFQSLDAIEATADAARASLRIADAWAGDAALANVLAVDAAFQAAGLAHAARYGESLAVPHAVERLCFGSAPPSSGATIHAAARGARFETARADVVVRAADGAPVLVAKGYARRALPSPTGLSFDPASWLYAEELVAVPSPAHLRDAASVRVALLGEDAANITRTLEGIGVEHVALRTPDAIAAWVAGGDATKKSVVLDLRAFDLRVLDGVALERAAWASVEALQACAAATAEIVFVVGGSGAGGPAFAALSGLRRTVEIEAPRLAVKVVEVDPVAARERVAAEILAADDEREIVWSGSERRAPRVRRLEAGAPSLTPSVASDEAPLIVGFDAQRTFFLRPARGGVLAPDEVRIAVKHAALNFRDLIKVLGLASSVGDAAEATRIGDECAGVVTEVGAAVRSLKPGDAVVARHAGRCLATEITVPQDYAFKKPAGVGDAEAAAIPVVFTTAWYALRTLARLAPGERVLIHSGAGGVGLAAIQIARACGAEIFCTAGTEEKRELLRKMGVRAVFSSKDLGFVEGIRALTDGEGVDVVLNSLVGAPMVESVGLLRPFGRFLEIGKRDLYADTPVGLHAFRRNVTYHAIDLAKLWSDRPKAARAVFDEVLAAFADGTLAPLPVTTFPLADVGAAFDRFSEGTHVGKIVLDMGTRGALAVVSKAGTRYGDLVRGDGSYVVTGGFGGMGAVVLRWLARAGAKRICVLSRSGASTKEAEALVASLREEGVRVDVCRGDVADAGFVARAVAELRASGAPIRGVLHLAGALADATVPRITARDVATVFGPKMGGALALREATRDQPLDFFMMFSSAVATMGSGGQGAYAMANGALDAFARVLRAEGVFAQSIAWGPFAGPGLMTRERLEERRRLGVGWITPEELAELLDQRIPADVPHAVVRPMDWAKFLDGTAPARLATFRREERAIEEDASLPARVRRADRPEGLRLAEGYLRETIARRRGVAADRIASSDDLAGLGFDSLALVDLLNRMSYDLGIAMAAFEVTAAATIASLAESVVRRITGGRAKPALPATPRRSTVVCSAMQHIHFRFYESSENAAPCWALYEASGPLDEGVVTKTLAFLSKRHDALRAAFAMEDGTLVQRIRPEVAPEVLRRRVKGEGDVNGALFELVLKPHDLADPMVRAVIVEQETTGKQVLGVAIHHLVTDQVSLWVLRREIPLIYGALERGAAPNLPPIETSFAEWADTVGSLADGEPLEYVGRAVRDVVARGPKPLAPKAQAYFRPLPTPKAKPSAARWIAAATAALGRVADVSGVIQYDAGRTSPTQDLTRTVGPIAGFRFVPVPGDGGERVGKELEDSIAFGRVWLEQLDDAEISAFQSRVATLNIWTAPDAPIEGAARLSPWSWERHIDIFISGRMMVEPQRKPRVTLPATGVFLIFGEFDRVIVFSSDPSFSDATVDAFVRELSSAVDERGA